MRENIIEGDQVDEIDKRIMLFETSNSFAEAGQSVSKLMELENRFNSADIKRIAEAPFKNDQIMHSFAAQSYLKRFFRKHADMLPADDVETILRLE